MWTLMFAVTLPKVSEPQGRGEVTVGVGERQEQDDFTESCALQEAVDSRKF